MLYLLTKPQPLKKKEWAAVIDARLEMMKKFLNLIPAKELKDVPCVSDGRDRVLSLHGLQHFLNPLRPNCKLEGSSELYFERIGIYEGFEDFKDSNWMPWETCRTEKTLVLWGLARNGKWLAAWASFDITEFNDNGVYRGSTARVAGIVIKEMNTAELIEELGKNGKVSSPHTILKLLFREYTRWFERYDERHSEAAQLNTTMQIEEALASRIS